MPSVSEFSLNALNHALNKMKIKSEEQEDYEDDKEKFFTHYEKQIMQLIQEVLKDKSPLQVVQANLFCNTKKYILEM